MKSSKFEILLVEDDEVEVMKVSRAFHRSSLDFPLHVAGNGVEALRALRGTDGREPLRPAIILLDINMPKMSGIEFLRELRIDPALKKLVVVILTTSNDERDVMAAYDLNVAGYIVKPVTFEKFVKVISALEQYWSLNELPA